MNVAGSSETPATSLPFKNVCKRVVVVGDSHARRVGEMFPASHRLVLGWGGATITSLVDHLKSRRLSVSYSVSAVFIIVGTNDIIRSVNGEKVTESAISLLELFKSIFPNAKYKFLPVFITRKVKQTVSSEYMNFIRDAVSFCKCGIICNRILLCEKDLSYSDNVHLSERGYKLVSDFCM